MIYRHYIELAMIDDDGAGGRMRVFFQPALSLASLEMWALAFAPLVQAATNAAIVEVKLVQKWQDTSAEQGPPGSDVSRALVLVLGTDGGSYAIQRIPAGHSYAPDDPSAAPWSVDMAAAPVVALVDALTSPIVLAANDLGEHYTSLQWAYVGIEQL